MNITKYVNIHVEIDVGEFSFQNIAVYILILFGLYGTVAPVVGFLPGFYYGLSRG